MPQVFHLGGGSSNFGLDSHLHRVQLGNGSERVVVQMNANGHIEFSNPVTGNAISFPVETMFGNVGLEMNGSMMSDAFAGGSTTYVGGGGGNDQDDTVTPVEVQTNFYPTGMNAADNLSNYPGFTNAMYFNGSDDYLSRNFGSGGDTSTWTWSGWVKRSSSSEQFIFGTGSASDQSTYYYHQFGGDNVLFVNWSGSINVSPNSLLRDFSSWYHLVLSFTSTNVDIFINGNEYSYAREDQPSSPTSINSNREHYIGVRSPNLGYLNGYMANIQFIDGQALDASAFGQYMVDSNGNTTSAWVPKLYDGDYGQNGFLLDFSKLGLDSSGNIDKVYDTAPISGGHTAANDWDAH